MNSLDIGIATAVLLIIVFTITIRFKRHKFDYPKFLRSTEWSRTKKAIREKYEDRCVICNSSSRLEVHHMNYKGKTLHDPRYLVLLCKKCHVRMHQAFPEMRRKGSKYE
jgi:5-methylcytosine-specific restriction endonuclease McrA